MPPDIPSNGARAGHSPDDRLIRRDVELNARESAHDALIEALLQKERWLAHLARRCATDPEHARELVQEAWLAALKQRPSADRTLEGWLARVLRNQAALGRRRSAHDCRDAVEERGVGRANDDGESPLVALEQGERSRVLRAAVVGLSEPYRSILSQRFFEERSVEDIARLRSEPRATVSTRLRRGLERLRGKLEAGGVSLPAWLGAGRTEVPASNSGAVSGAQPASSLRSATWVRLALGGLVLAGAVLTVSLVLASENESADLVGSADVQGASNGGTDMQTVASPLRVVATGSAIQATAQGAAVPSIARLVDDEGVALGAGVHVLLPGGPKPYELVTDAAGHVTVPDELVRATASSWLLVELPESPSVARGGVAPRFFVPADRNHDGPLAWTIVVSSTPVLRVSLPPEAPAAFATDPMGIIVALRSRLPGMTTLPRPRYGPAAVGRELVVQLPAVRQLEARDFGLIVVDPTGLWGDILDLDALERTESPLLFADWRPLAGLSLVVQDNEGWPLPGALVELGPVDSEGSFPERSWRTALFHDGTVQIGAFEPGEYRLRVSAVDLVSEEHVTLVPGRMIERAVRLESSGPAARVTGRIVSASGDYRLPIVVALESDGAEPSFVEVEWVESEAGSVAEFELAAGAATRVRVMPVPVGDHCRIEPAVVEVAPGGPQLEFVCRDDLRGVSIDFSARYADGTPLESFQVDVSGGAGARYTLHRLPPDPLGAARWRVSTHRLTWTTRTGAALVGVPVGDTLDYVVRAGGCQPVSGRVVAALAGTTQAIEVALPAR